MLNIWRDVRYGVRVLAKSPGFTAACILTLALGVGANTAVFSIVNSLLFRPLPVKDAQQITMLALRQRHGPLTNTFSYPELRDLRANTTGAFSAVFGCQLGLDGLSTRGSADRLFTAFVTGNFFSALGVEPALGRFIDRGESETNASNPGIVLSYAYWQSRFAGSPSVIGQAVVFDGRPATIIGVAPKGFHGLYSVLDTQAYLPLSMAVAEGLPANFLENRTLRNLNVYGRLQPQETLQHGQAVLKVVASRIAQDHPESDKDLTLELFPELRTRPGGPDANGTIVTISTLFLALAALVLLLACVNVANFLLVRATVRQREMAIRVALGAARQTLVRQLLTESLLLGLAGGAGGVLLGSLASGALSSLRVGTDLPFRLDFTFDWRVFSYAFAGALITGIVVGVVPALRASKADVNEVLHQGGRGSVGGRHRLRNALVSAQVAASLALLIIAGLFTRSLSAVQHVDLGFDPTHVANFDMDPSEIGYNEVQGQAFYRSLLDRVRALPGVRSVSLASTVPMGYVGAGDNVTVPGREAKVLMPIQYDVITPDYFATMSIKVLRGRVFTAADTANSTFVAIISQAMAQKLWPNQDPMGREFRMESDPAHTLRVIGVTNDTRQHPPVKFDPFFYVPLAQHYAGNSFQTLQVRTGGDPRAIMPEVQRAIHALASDLPVFDVHTMEEALYTFNGLLIFELGAGLAGALGALGLVLAVIGVYGVISYAATQQTHEIGLRMALGAQPASILGMIFSRGLLIVVIGLTVGLALTVAAAGFVSKFVLVSATDPLTYCTVTALLTLVALVACYIPSRRAMRVDPMVALRYD